MIRRYIPEVVITGCKSCPYHDAKYKNPATMPYGWCGHPDKKFGNWLDSPTRIPADDFIDPNCPLPVVMADALKLVTDELLAMPEEEFRAMLEEDKSERCDPDTCGGACQGMGWCYTCEDFRGEAPDDHMEELMA